MFEAPNSDISPIAHQNWTNWTKQTALPQIDPVRDDLPCFPAQILSFILYAGYSHSAPCFTVVSDVGEVRVFDGAKYFSTKKGNTLASNHQGLLEYSPIKGELIILNKPGSINPPQKTNQSTIINHHLRSCINYIRIFGGGGLNPHCMVIQILS